MHPRNGDRLESQLDFKRVNGNCVRMKSCLHQQNKVKNDNICNEKNNKMVLFQSFL